MADSGDSGDGNIKKRRKWRSGNICCAVNCSNREGRDKVQFYRIPSAKKPGVRARRAAWLLSISRGGNWKPSKHSRLCSNHFVSGYKSENPASPNYVPRVFSHRKPKAERERRPPARRLFNDLSNETGQGQADEAGISPLESTPEPMVENDRHEDEEAASPSITDREDSGLKDEALGLSATRSLSSDVKENLKMLTPDVRLAVLKRIEELETRNKELENMLEETRRKTLNVDDIKDNPAKMKYYTGFVNWSTFMALYAYLEPKASNMRYWRGSQESRRGTKHYASHKDNKLSKLDEFFMVMVRLRLGLLVGDLADRFGISQSACSKIFTTWINLLHHELTAICQFTSKEKNQETMPEQFKNFLHTRVIIDCTELFVERPSSLEAQRQTFSNYKHHNTFKFLIGISPNGAIIYVSRAWGGRASDKLITRNSDFTNYVETGDGVMADRGFDVQAELSPLGAQLIIPAFKGSNRSQLSSQEVMQSKRVAEVRIHVERAIGRIRTFHILDTDMKLSMKDIAEQIFTVCAFLTNFQSEYIK